MRFETSETALVARPQVRPALEEILGPGYRMDHSPDLMRMQVSVITHAPCTALRYERDGLEH
jgi:hypothetical protein